MEQAALARAKYARANGIGLSSAHPAKVWRCRKCTGSKTIKTLQCEQPCPPWGGGAADAAAAAAGAADGTADAGGEFENGRGGLHG